MEKIKFFVASSIESPCDYQHQIISIAEGFRALKIGFCGNCDYWFELTLGSYLIEEDRGEEFADINIFSMAYFRINPINSVGLNQRKINFLLDDSDGITTPANDPRFAHLTCILRSHYNRAYCYNDNVLPWAFGLTNRIIEALPASALYDLNRLAVNYRVAYSTRRRANRVMLPLLANEFVVDDRITKTKERGKCNKRFLEASLEFQTGFRHSPEYFGILNKSGFVFCFGGPVIEKQGFRVLQKNICYPAKLLRIISEIAFEKGVPFKFINYQFDSWRFWETLASNAIPVQMDFESWGFEFPVNPQNRIHYLGVEGSDFCGAATEMISIKRNGHSPIGSEGRSWALRNYSPKAVATRFCNTVALITGVRV